jgi:poly(hydroxyalkanoate) depolymerase family esterase
MAARRKSNTSKLLLFPRLPQTVFWPAVTPRTSPAVKPVAAGRVTEVTGFGTNPGELRMFVYTPAKRLRAGAPLIVVLHGCGQYAESFARNAGWLALAEHCGAALLLPEQRATNNQGRCFNWYRPGDAGRGSGEAMSVRQMVRAAIKRFGSNPRQVFVVGLSAGGALAAALLAAYPTVFSAGAVVAGMPVGAAHGTAAAMLRMHHASRFNSRIGLANDVRRAAPPSQSRKWPRLAIWHGGQDRVIDPANGEVLAAQWSELHGYGETPSIDEVSATGIRRRIWGTAKRPVVEFWTIPEMGHGFPIDASLPGGGHNGFGIVNAGIPAARHIAKFWGMVIV